ncbi:MAG: hypothetical protein A4E58_00015 [Syntrophorhabdus sp. PtaB.Bin006]|nr:MAG: hypothetical protein A4E58_00015 [Syntrophorhabdus sp. PtaB.Bin006]
MAVGDCYGINVHLGDLGKVNDEVGEVDDKMYQLLHVCRGFSAVALENIVHLRLLYEPPRQGLVEGRESDGNILEYLSPDASHAEEDDGPEILILFCSKDHLIIDAFKHFLDAHP